MAIDILNLEPTVISRDLRGKYILIYGKPKSGKTTLSSKFPKNLLLAFEKGYNAIDNIYAQDINRWSDFKQVLRQLEKPEARQRYDTITIDTATIAYDMCEQYVCAQNGVQTIRDIPWGQGWGLVKKEFESCLRKITMLGYGLVLISHIETRKEKTSDDSEIEILAPSMPKRCYEVVNQIVDIIGYISTEWDENGESHRYLYTRATPTVMAGSRFKYLAPKIPLGYNELVEAINEAIDEQKERADADVEEMREQNGNARHAARDDFGRIEQKCERERKNERSDDEQKLKSFFHLKFLSAVFLTAVRLFFYVFYCVFKRLAPMLKIIEAVEAC